MNNEADISQVPWLHSLLTKYAPNGVEWKRLGEIASYMDGAAHEHFMHPEVDKYVVCKVRFISSDGNYKMYSDRRPSPVNAGDVIMVMSDVPNGKSLAKCYYIDIDDLYTINQRVCCLSANIEVIRSKYLYYVLNRNPQLLMHDNGLTQTHLKKKWILDVKIPLIPLGMQDVLVEFWDKMLQMSNDLSSCITSEIEARKKQYEYYRDKLLSFNVREY